MVCVSVVGVCPPNKEANVRRASDRPYNPALAVREKCTNASPACGQPRDKTPELVPPLSAGQSKHQEENPPCLAKWGSEPHPGRECADDIKYERVHATPRRQSADRGVSRGHRQLTIPRSKRCFRSSLHKSSASRNNDIRVGLWWRRRLRQRPRVQDVDRIADVQALAEPARACSVSIDLQASRVVPIL